jgi:hypothetical protein
MKFFIGFLASMYLLGVAGFAVGYYVADPEQGLFDAVVYGLAWPSILVEMARSLGL